MSISILHPKSVETQIPQLDLFAVNPTQMSVKSGRYVPYTAKISNSNISGGGSVIFDLDVTNNFRDYNDSKLHLQCKIINADGTNLAENQVAAFVNNPISSLFQNIEIDINGNVITKNNGTDAYRCYIQQKLSQNQDSKETRLTCSGYYEDDPGLFDSIDLNENNNLVNSGFRKRFSLCKESSIADLIGDVQADFFATGKYVPGELKTKLTLTRAKDSFCIMGDKKDYKVEIVQAIFYLREVEVSGSIKMEILDNWIKEPLRYPIKKTETRYFPINPNTPSIEIDIGNGDDSHLPKLLAVMFVDKNAFVGSYDKNPFNFQHFNLSEVEAKISGYPLAPKIQFDFDRNIFVRGFESLFHSRKVNEHGNHISRAAYKRGNMMICYDLTPDNSDGPFIDFKRTGKLSLSLQFRKNTLDVIYMICYYEYDAVIEIYKNNTITTIV
jgi:hypothetical protein